MKVTELFTSFLDILFPNLCLICNESLSGSENRVCLSCLHNIPRTGFHHIKNNPVEKRFWGKVPVEQATSFFFFQKGSPFQKLLHQLKYNGNKELGQILGSCAAIDLRESDFFGSVDIIIPVPLHPKKLAKRGYNQSEWIAKGLSEVLGINVDTKHLVRLQEKTTQTKKSVYERYTNTKGIFGVNNANELEGKHILLVDDVLTTGSTLEACIQAVLSTPGTKVSVFTLAVA